MHRLEHVRKKVRHVDQSKVAQSHFDLVNWHHADFDIGKTLCSKNRVPVGVHNNDNNNTRISAPRRLQNLDFPPSFLLVYETQTCGRLGKKKNVKDWVAKIEKNEKSHLTYSH